MAEQVLEVADNSIAISYRSARFSSHIMSVILEWRSPMSPSTHISARSLVLLLWLSSVSIVSATRIDPDLPQITSAPLPLPIQFQFQTSWDGINWTSEEKDTIRSAIGYLNTWFVDQPAFVELASPNDFTLRWAGPDFFKDWGKHGPWDLNNQTAIAFSAKSETLVTRLGIHRSIHLVKSTLIQQLNFILATTLRHPTNMIIFPSPSMKQGT